MKKTIFLEIMCGLFTCLFLYTGTMKLIDHNTFVYDLGRDPMIGKPLATFTSFALPVVELAVVALILIPKTQKWGIYSTIMLMLSFTVYVRWMINNPTRHCTCGGVLRQMTWRQHFWFNVLFTSIALLTAILYNRNRQALQTSRYITTPVVR